MKNTSDFIKNIQYTLQNRTPKPITKYSYSSVMILLFCINNDIHMLFTKRAEHLIHQPGDISFPGGRKEKGSGGFFAGKRVLLLGAGDRLRH